MATRSRRFGPNVGLFLPLVVFTGALLGACGDGAAPSDYTAEELEAAKAELRDHARLRTFEAGKLFGEEWVARAPDDAELRGLYAYQLVGWRLSKEIHEQADAIRADDPDNPWGLYAKAYAHYVDNDVTPATELVREAWEAAPQPEFAFLYLRVLSRDDFEAAWKFLESLDEETRAWPEVLRMQAELESQARYRRQDPTWADSSRATWAEFKERFPDHVLGYTRLANEAYQARRMDEWTPLMEAALELAPGSSEVRSQHWRGLWMSELLPREERRPAVEASMAAFREASPETPPGLYAMASMYRNMEDEERAAELEARIVESDPGSFYASMVYLAELQGANDKLSELREEHDSDSPEVRAQLEVVREAVYEYLERPLYSDTYKGTAYITLYFALNAMDPIPVEDFADAVRGLADLGEPAAAGDLAGLYRELAESLAGRRFESLAADAPAVVAALGLQIEILRALVELDAPRGVDAFIDGATSPAVPRDSQTALRIAEGFYERRRMALYCLGYSASRRAADVLEGADGIGHPDPRLRTAAVRSLAVLAAPGAAARLLPVLRDPVPEVRWTAAMALGRLRYAGAVDALIERLDDKFGEVRRQAALALGYIGEPKASLALAQLAIDEPVASVRETALYAMDLLDSAD